MTNRVANAADLKLSDSDPTEAWAVASALEVLANYFDARPGSGGVQFRAIASAAVIKVAAGVGDAIADRLRGWAEAIKAPISQHTGGHSLPTDTAIFIWDPVAEAERSIRVAQDEQQQSARLDRWIAILDRLAELGGAEAKPLLNELDGVHGQAIADAEDRVMYVAADVLSEAREWPVFARIFATVLEGSYYETGDEVDFYYRRNRGSNLRCEKRAPRWRLESAESQRARDEAGTLPSPETWGTWYVYVSTALGAHQRGDVNCTVDDCGARVDGTHPEDCPKGCGGLVHTGMVTGAEWAKCDRCIWRSDPMGWTFDSEGRLHGRRD